MQPDALKYNLEINYLLTIKKYNLKKSILIFAATATIGTAASNNETKSATETGKLIKI